VKRPKVANVVGLLIWSVFLIKVVQWASWRQADDYIASLPVDTANAAMYRWLLKDADQKYDGLRAKLEGIQKLKPQTRTVYDTLIQRIVEPVAERVVIGDGKVETLVLRPDSNGFQPVRERFTYKNCDDRLEFIRGQVICNKARLGHVTLFARAGLSSNINVPNPAAILDAGISWQPSYRSTTQVEIYGDGQGRASATFRTGWRIF
jgi:hypothetical protein